MHSKILSVAVLILASMSAAAQTPTPTPAPGAPRAGSTPAARPAATPDPKAPATAESVAESVILVYSGLSGRERLDQIRKTSVERGRMRLPNEQGQFEQVNYQRWSIRGESLAKERIRLEQEFPSLRYTLVYSDEKTFGVFNDSVFAPRADAARAFENRVFHGIEALLRYKESGSAIELAGREKILGVEFFQLDVTDTQGRKTRFYISTKSYRVMMLDYEADGVKYRRKFYNYNYAQGTLVPYRTTLTAGGRVIEETDVHTVTFGQKVDEEMFKPAS
jgi:hypothetical protein